MDSEPPLMLENINVFITAVARARVEDLEIDMERMREARETLCEYLVKRAVGFDVCIHHGIIEEPVVDPRPLIEYASGVGIQNPSPDDLFYIGRYIFGHDITLALSRDDENTLNIGYLEETPFIRLDLREITIKLGNGFPVEGLRNMALRCHPTAIVHRLGAAAVTCWVEVPTRLTVEDTNGLIETLIEKQVEIEVLGKTETKIETSTLDEFLHTLAVLLLASLIQVLRGEEPGPERIQREDIRRYIEDISTSNVVLHVGGVSMKKEDGNTAPITSAEDLVKCCPRQVASLATGLIDWRSYVLDDAVRDYREALAAIYQDELVMAGARGIVIYLGKPGEPDFLKNVNSALRDPDHERHHHSVLQSLADNVLQIYQLVGIVKAALDTYNLKIRRYPLERARLEEIERLLDLVERGLEEIDYYSLVRAEPMRTVLRMALKVRGVLGLKKVVERRLVHIHRILVERASRRTNLSLLLLTFYLGAISIVQTLLTALGMGSWPVFLIVVFIITATTIIALRIVRLILGVGVARRLWRVFRSLAGL